MSFNERDLPALDPRARTLARLVILQERSPSDVRARRILGIAHELLSTEEELANAWIESDDTGTSSETIWSVMTGRMFLPGRGWRGRTPSDGDDFGRCYRLIAKIPAWRKRLPEVAKAHPYWATIIRDWDRLGALYEAAIKATETRARPTRRGRELPFPEEIAFSAALDDLNIESGALVDPSRPRKATP
jgi:hypothetical protein